jgi:CIC family chloride channel protein
MIKREGGVLSLRKGLIRLKYSLSNKNIIFALSIGIGIASAFAAIGLKTGVHAVEHILRTALGADLPSIALFFFPVIGIGLTLAFTRLIIKDDISHGVSKVIYAISKNKSRFKLHNLFSSLLACTLTVGFGGSVGMEAPILLTGAAIGSKSAELFRMNRKMRTLLLCCGTAAVVSAIFKAPITGLIFTLEVFMVGTSVNMIIPILISAVTADLVSILASSTQIEFHFAVYETFHVRNAPFYILLGI